MGAVIMSQMFSPVVLLVGIYRLNEVEAVEDVDAHGDGLEQIAGDQRQGDGVLAKRRRSILVRSAASEEGPKNPLKGIAVKPLVPAANAQFGVGAGREARTPRAPRCPTAT